MSKLNIVWLSLEQGMQNRSNYYQYGRSEPIHAVDIQNAAQDWPAATSQGPGNFHLPEKLDPFFNDFISFENMFTVGTSTVPSLTSAFSGVPHYLHFLKHTKKTEMSGDGQVTEFPFLFDLLQDNGYQVGGFHLFENPGPSFVIPDFEQGYTDDIRSWPSPWPSHHNYAAQVARLNHYLQETSSKAPHAIVVHMFPQTLPAAMEVLEAHGIDRSNTVFVIAGDHGHPNWDYYGRHWVPVHDLEPDVMNTQIYCKFYYPGCQPRSVSEVHANIDFFPTILHLLDIDTTFPPDIASLCGTSLIEQWREQTSPVERRFVRIGNRYHLQLHARSNALLTEGWRYEYMHFLNIHLHDYYRENGIRIYKPEMLFRNTGNGNESPVHIENPTIQPLLKEFRAYRLTSDKTIQTYWTQLIRDPDIRQSLLEDIEKISPQADDLLSQIAQSERIDLRLKNAFESQIDEVIEKAGEIKRATLPSYYFPHFLHTNPVLENKKIAVWGTGYVFENFFKPHLEKYSIEFFVDDSNATPCTINENIEVGSPDLLKENPVDILIIAEDPSHMNRVIQEVRALGLEKEPLYV